MRIIAGINRGRKIFAPKGMNTRPTADRVREAMFYVLAPYVEDSAVLDVFGGTGAFSLEALSRGADSAVIIDKDRRAITAIKENISLCKANEQVTVYSGDAFTILPILKEKFDLIFLDPPYAKDLLFPAISLILKYELMKNDGILVLETAASYVLPPVPLEIKKESVYGDTKIIYCVKRR